MIEACVSFRRPISEEDSQCGDPPYCHLDPLQACHYAVERDSRAAYVELSPTIHRVGAGKGTYGQRRSDSSHAGGDVHPTLGHCGSGSAKILTATCLGLLGRHLLGKISLGTLYARGTAANPNPMSA